MSPKKGWLCLVLFPFFLACSLVPKDTITPKGQILVYLQAEGPPTYETVFSLSRIFLEDKEGKEVPLALRSHTLSSSFLFNQQILLAQGVVDVGSYNSINLEISQAKLIKDNKKLLLKINQRLIKIPVDLFIPRDKTSSLFLRWQPSGSVQHQTLFVPVINVTQGKVGLKKLLLYVSNAGENYLSVIDRGTNQVIDTVTVGESPKGMALSEDGAYLYVVNSLSKSISVVETATNRVVDEIRLPMAVEPTEIVLLPDTSYLYVSAKGSNAVLVVDVQTRRVIKTIEVGQGPVGLAVDPERRYVYVANSYSNSVSVIDTSTNEVVNTVGVGAEPCFLAYSNNYLLVASGQSNTVSVIDVNTLSVRHNIFVPGRPSKIIKGLKGWFYVAGELMDCVYFVLPNVDISPKRLITGRKPMGMALDRDRKLLYVVNAQDNSVDVFDLIKEREIQKIEVGSRPYDLILTED